MSFVVVTPLEALERASYLLDRGSAPSRFDAEVVFRACERFSTAVEINCRPERLDPPDDLLALAW